MNIVAENHCDHFYVNVLAQDMGILLQNIQQQLRGVIV